MIWEPSDIHVEAIVRTRGDLQPWKDGDGTCLGYEGVVWTPHGAVAVLSSQRTGRTLYRLAYRGKLYRQYVPQYNPSTRTLARDARRFADAVTLLR